VFQMNKRRRQVSKLGCCSLEKKKTLGVCSQLIQVPSRKKVFFDADLFKIKQKYFPKAET